MPSKYLREDEALIGISAEILPHIRTNIFISDLWEAVKMQPNINNFERFVLALELLYILGLIEIENNKLTRT